MRAFTVLDMPQRSPEWVAARLGRVTASVAVEMLAKIQKGEAASRRNLRVRLMLERIVGRSLESDYQSPAMLAGIEREAAALRAYEALTGALVRRSGFLQHTSLMAGASLDGHLGDFEVVVEAKAPEHAAHLEYLTTRKVPDTYAKQIRHQLWLTGAREAHFLSYQPDFPEDLRVLLVTVPRDEAAIKQYDADLQTFLGEVDLAVHALATIRNPRQAWADAAAAQGVAV